MVVYTILPSNKGQGCYIKSSGINVITYSNYALFILYHAVWIHSKSSVNIDQINNLGISVSNIIKVGLLIITGTPSWNSEEKEKLTAFSAKTFVCVKRTNLIR